MGDIELPQPRRPGAGHAVDWLARTLRERPGEVTIIAIGPLTNIARYLHEHGTGGIERIVLMGGAIAEGNMTPAAEFNIWADPEAAQTVLDAPLDVTMIGLDVTQHGEEAYVSGEGAILIEPHETDRRGQRVLAGETAL